MDKISIPINYGGSPVDYSAAGGYKGPLGIVEHTLYRADNMLAVTKEGGIAVVYPTQTPNSRGEGSEWTLHYFDTQFEYRVYHGAMVLTRNPDGTALDMYVGRGIEMNSMFADSHGSHSVDNFLEGGREGMSRWFYPEGESESNDAIRRQIDQVVSGQYDRITSKSKIIEPWETVLQLDRNASLNLLKQNSYGAVFGINPTIVSQDSAAEGTRYVELSNGQKAVFVESEAYPLWDRSQRHLYPKKNLRSEEGRSLIERRIAEAA